MKPILSILLLVALSGTAAAQRGDLFDPLTMDRHTPVTTLSFELGYEVWEENNVVELEATTLRLAGHFVSRSGAGAYGVLPMTFVSVTTPLDEDSELALGNVEAGGMYAKWFGRTALVFHAGIALPTAQDEGAAGAQFIGAFTRLGDIPQHVIDSTWLRLGISPMGRARNLFWRVDIGLDLALDEDNAPEYSPIFHLNAGGGVDLGAAQLVAELVNVFADPEDNSDDSASTFAFGARFNAGTLRPGVGLMLPMDFDGADDFEWALLGSLAVRVR